MSILGCDISGWQPGNVDLSGMEFVYVKATQGTYKVNANHDAQVAQARALGLIVGHYHFPAWGNPQAEAQAFVSASGWRPGEFMVLDIENSVQTPWPTDPVSWCVAFELEAARLLGIWCLDYAGPNVRSGWDWTPLAALGGGLIDPEYNPVGPSSSAPWANVAMWQNADTNISGGDSDVFYGDRAALTAYGTPGTVTQSGTITPIQEDDMPNFSDNTIHDKDGNVSSPEKVLNSIDAKATDGVATANKALLASQQALAAVQGLLATQLADPTDPKKAYPLATWIVWSATHAKLAPANTLNQTFKLSDGTTTNLPGILDRINSKPDGATVTNTVAALNAADLAALAKAVNDESDARARVRLATP